jgi:hypothetical protein
MYSFDSFILHLFLFSFHPLLFLQFILLFLSIIASSDNAILHALKIVNHPYAQPVFS